MIDLALGILAMFGICVLMTVIGVLPWVIFAAPVMGWPWEDRR